MYHSRSTNLIVIQLDWHFLNNASFPTMQVILTRQKSFPIDRRNLFCVHFDAAQDVFLGDKQNYIYSMESMTAIELSLIATPREFSGRQ